MKIGKHDTAERVFVVAELSCNHMQDLGVAGALMLAARAAGADAVKLQHDNPLGGITIKCDAAPFRITDGPWAGNTLHELYLKTHTPWQWIGQLSRLAAAWGMECFSTPSCIPGVDFLEDHKVPAYKISSFEVTDYELVRRIAKTGKPVILSDGCAMHSDILFARKHIRNLAVLCCASKYENTTVEDYDLRLLGTWERDGISDHTLGPTAAVAAVGRGARIVEKHLTLSRELGGPDAGFSATPEEFKEMVTQIRAVEAALSTRAREVDQKWCKSLFAVKDIKKGERFTEENIGIIRPGAGMHPKHYRKILGCKAKLDIVCGTPIKESMI